MDYFWYLSSESIPKRDEDTIIYLITTEYKRVAEVARAFGKSRQAIYDVLKRRGVNIKDYVWIEVTCDYCGKEFKKRRCLVRGSKLDFCSREHVCRYMNEKM